VSAPLAYLDEAAVRSVLRWDELIAAMEDALAAFSTGRVMQPVRSVLTIEENARFFAVMPAVTDDAMGLKCVTFYPRNEGTALPTHMAIVLLFSPQTGEPLALMDGRLITEMRTAAVSAAVTKRLAAPESRILAILGSGVQAKAHLEALSGLYDCSEVRVWSRTPDHAKRFAGAHGATAMEAEAAVRDADIVVVATSAQAPVLAGRWLKRGAHVNAVGAARPTWRELDDDAMRNIIVVDSREAAVKESGDVVQTKPTIYAEAGELFAGLAAAPVAETTIFKSLGLAVEDVASAKLIYQRIQARKEMTVP